jgi:adhesin/invasin
MKQQGLLLVTLIFLVGFCSAQNYPNTIGKEFLLGFLRNYDNSGSSNRLQLFISSEKNASVTISSNYVNFTAQIVNVTAGTVKVVDLPVAMRCVANTLENKGVLISSDQDIALVGLNQLKSTTDAFLAIPTDITGSTEFRVVSYTTTNAGGAGSSQIGLFALRDNTEITVTFSGSSSFKGTTKNITLNALQSNVIEDSVDATDLTGSLVTSNKPISVFGANWCANIPFNKNYCDILVEQIIPLSTWGQTYYTVPLAKRKGGDIFRVV